jgi:hypothetical protein
MVQISFPITPKMWENYVTCREADEGELGSRNLCKK